MTSPSRCAKLSKNTTLFLCRTSYLFLGRKIIWWTRDGVLGGIMPMEPLQKLFFVTSLFLVADSFRVPCTPWYLGTRGGRSRTICRSSLDAVESISIGCKRLVYNQLMSWMSHKGALLSSNIETRVRSAIEGGAGVFASNNIKKDETIITLPSAHYDINALVQIVPEQSNALSTLKRLADGDKDDKTLALIGALAYAFLIQSHSDHVNKTLGPYLNVLSATDCEDHVIHWSQDEVDSLLANTIAWTKVQDTRQALSRMVDYVTPSFSSCDPPFVYSKQDISFNMYKSFALADSRVFSHPTQGYQVHPIIDLINHSNESNVKWYLPDDARARVVATRDIMKGEEILANYGLKPSWDWGADYGFCPDYSGTQDFVAIPLLPLSLELSDDEEMAILETLHDTVKGSIILPLTCKKSLSSQTRIMRPCIVWRRSAAFLELVPIFDPVVQVLEVMKKENRVASHQELLRRQDSQDSGHVDKVYELVVDCLSSRLEYLQDSSMLAMEWMQTNHEQVRNGRTFLADRLRDAEWNACVNMKFELQSLLYKNRHTMV